MERSPERYILDNFDIALELGHIQVYYQPVIRTISGQLCSFEALARWIDPVRGMLRPDQFIPVLEREKLIHRLDAHIVREVCRRIRLSIDRDGAPVPVSVNLSRMDFTLCDIFEEVDSCVTELQIPHDFLYIEITESVLAEQEHMMHAVIERFQSAGYQVWMDDFGSAYSSLNMLKEYSLNELKLDIRFLSSFSQRSRRILTSMIQMAKEIDIHTLAEGVETEEQFLYLRDIGCEKVQGYYFGRPMPYEDALAHLEKQGVGVEPPSHRRYYDDIGRINFLSSIPFLSRQEERHAASGLQLNSIALALAEIRRDAVTTLFCNAAFEENAEGIDMLPPVFHSDQLGLSFPLSSVPVRVLEMLQSTRAEGEGRMLFVSREQYFELKAKCMARRQDAFCVLMQLNNLSQSGQETDTSRLDDSLRQIYTLYDRIILIHISENTVTPLYVGLMDYLTETDGDLNVVAQRFAKKWIFLDDREEYLRFWDFSTLEARLEASGRGFISAYFRYRVSGGEYNWKQTVLLRYRPGVVLELVHNAQEELHQFRRRDAAMNQADSAYPPELLWRNLVQTDVLRFFWKDRDRRFLGVNRGFLDFYGFESAKELIGKTDEDMGWHVHPDLYMNDEMRVLHEGITTHSVAGRCISNGENREILATKTPLYNDAGEIIGLIGSFQDRAVMTEDGGRGRGTVSRDEMTGLLNSRGLFEHVHAFQDEYFLRNTDFMRLHIAIDDLASINRQYGFDFGDKVIAALGKELNRIFGTSSAVGRINGYQFVVLRQVRGKNELSTLYAKVKQIADSIREIDGTPITLYLSIGYALFSEFEDADQMAQSAEMRLLVDHDNHSPIENLQSRSSGFFRLYDDLPISYAVYKVQVNRRRRATDAVIFYANHLFEQMSGKTAEELLGRSVREIFPGLDSRWFDMAGRAAFSGEKLSDTLTYAATGLQYFITANQVIRPGYCSFTYQPLDSDGRPMAPEQHAN